VKEHKHGKVDDLNEHDDSIGDPQGSPAGASIL